MTRPESVAHKNGTANAFMTVFISVLILAAISLGVLALVYGIILLLSRSNSTWATRHQEMFPLWTRAWGLRLVCSAHDQLDSRTHAFDRV